MICVDMCLSVFIVSSAAEPSPCPSSRHPVRASAVHNLVLSISLQLDFFSLDSPLWAVTFTLLRAVLLQVKTSYLLSVGESILFSSSLICVQNILFLIYSFLIRVFFSFYFIKGLSPQHFYLSIYTYLSGYNETP